MKSSWVGLGACALVIYFGLIHASSAPEVLLNPHALILVLGGTLAIALLTYTIPRLFEVVDYVMFGFLFRQKGGERDFARDLLAKIDMTYGIKPVIAPSAKVHRFITEAVDLMHLQPDAKQLQSVLLDRRNAIKRKYMDDAKILNNIAKYPPHLGLLGAASGMIEMMGGLGQVGVETIGLSMATALTATLWGVGLNNFIFLPLSDNAMKAAEDEIYLRDIVIECCLLMKKGTDHTTVINTCLNKLAFLDRAAISKEYVAGQKQQGWGRDAA